MSALLDQLLDPERLASVASHDDRERACVVRYRPGCRKFETPGEARAAERGWEDAANGLPAIEPLRAYMLGRNDWAKREQMRDDERRERAIERRDE